MEKKGLLTSAAQRGDAMRMADAGFGVSNPTHIERTLREERSGLLVRRFRISLWIGLFTLALFMIADLDRHDPAGAVFGCYYIVVAIVLTCLAALGSERLRERIVGLAVVVIVVLFTIVAALGILTDDLSVSPLVFISVTMSAATLFPWGVRPQVVVAAAALLAAAWNVGAARVEAPPELVYALLALVFAAVISIYIAYELDRHWRERLIAMEALRRSEEQVRSMVESALDAVIAIDGPGAIVSWNRQAEATFGWPREEVLGRRMSELIIPPRHKEEHERGVHRFLSSGAGPILGRRIEISALHRDGREFPIELSISPIQLGDQWMFSAFVRDITDRRRTEESLRAAKEAADAANRVKSEFLANMSHEIRTPMNGVIGMTGLLLDTPLNAEQREYVELVRSSGEALMTIINDVLDFSKIEAGEMDLEIVEFDLATTVAEAVELVAENAQKKGLEIAYVMHAAVPPWVGGDPGRLRQVLLNLLGNAIKFTAKGEIVVRITLEEDLGASARVRFEVSDTGIGISAEAADHLFQPFVQVDASITRKYGGTGLGLSISKRLCVLMGGSVGVESEPGRGSKFWFVIRLEKRTGAVIARPDVSGLRGLRALVVDDSAASREILRLELERAGIDVDCADGALRGLERLKTEAPGRYSVLLVDQRMAGMDGLKLARTVKALPVGKALPIVLLTDYGERGDARRALGSGVAAYLMKPVRPAQLFECIAQVTAHAAEPARLVTRHTLSEQRALARGRVLVAEDNPVNQRVAALFLSRLGYRAEVVGDGEEAVDAVARAPYDAVLMDCQMPRMDGFEAARRIRRSESGARRVAIIAMTADALDGSRERCLGAGMDDYVSKPVTLEVLDRVLARWVRPGFEADDGRPAVHAGRHEHQPPAGEPTIT